jgi:hypothetical protein
MELRRAQTIKLVFNRCFTAVWWTTSENFAKNNRDARKIQVI